MEAELDEELRFHIDRQTDENVARGMDPVAARREALLAMGGLDRRMEECREARGLSLIENLLRDLRHGFRSLARNPGFSLVAVLILTLGIGANTAMFTVANAVLFRPLSYHDPDRLVVIGYRGTTVAPADFLQAMLYGVGPNDPATFVLVLALLGLVGVVASWIPARRASRVNPVVALRSE